MSILRKSNKRASARSQIDIEGVKDGMLILPGHKYRMVLAVSPINFELRSDEEQDAIIDIYESFLNSIGHPLQIIIRTREIDMDNYLSDLTERFKGEKVKVYKQQLKNYNAFIRRLISTNKILTRHFYVVVPFEDTQKLDLASARAQLNLRVDIVQKGLAKLAIQTRELSSLEVLDLFYSFYSPTQAKIQPLTQQALELLHTSYIKREVL